jgi:hypothetical protein
MELRVAGPDIRSAFPLAFSASIGSQGNKRRYRKHRMISPLLLISLFLVIPSSRGNVRVYVQETNGMAEICYECTAGEVIRALALDLTVDHGAIIAVTNFFRGPSTASAQGFGIFPASFRDHVTVYSGTNADWNANDYSPVAVVADQPADTLPGLNSSGLTLELGAIWDPAVSAAVPPPRGTLCALRISQPAHVSIAANVSRGGIVVSPPDVHLTPQFTGALIGPAITSAKLANGVMTILFKGGELERAPAVGGPWTGTANTNGTYTETIGAFPARFYRVHRP